MDCKNTEAMTDLIARLTAAPEGSRGLDYEIHCLMYEACGAYGPHPHYTTSLDAAMALVPPHYYLTTLAEYADQSGRWLARLADRGTAGNVSMPFGHAATPALALSAAALKAQGHE